MKKLRLHLDDLQIDSFSTTSVKRDKGTVYGEQCTCRTVCTCPGCPTCDASCNGTCDASCNGTCDASCIDGTCGGTCFNCTGGTADYTCQSYFVTAQGPGECIMC